ncbi:MAG TPA: CYCXC family (seleno)protein [Candidatus Binatia bacterium]
MSKKKKINKGEKPGRAKKAGLRLASLLVTVALIVAAWVYANNPSRSSNLQPNEGSAYVRRETKTLLSPALFVGKTETAYRVAEEISDVIDQLYCYCECDKHSGHRSLLSCFTDNHAANCDICQDEALDAAKMMKQGYSVVEIRSRIDGKYSRL